MEEVFNSKIIWGRLKYLVKWIGYEADWQPAENVNKLQAIECYEVTPATIISCGILCASTEARAKVQVDVV